MTFVTGLPISVRFGADDALSLPALIGILMLMRIVMKCSFISTGCVGCHNGRNLGDAAQVRPGEGLLARDRSQKIDEGRFSITEKEEDRYLFRVPILRNVARTAPYFHDGSVESLEAVRIMAEVQLARTLERCSGRQHRFVS